MTAKRRGWLRTLFFPQDPIAAEISEKRRLLSQLRADELALSLRKADLETRLRPIKCPSCGKPRARHSRICPHCDGVGSSPGGADVSR